MSANSAEVRPPEHMTLLPRPEVLPEMTRPAVLTRPRRVPRIVEPTRSQREQQEYFRRKNPPRSDMGQAPHYIYDLHGTWDE